MNRTQLLIGAVLAAIIGPALGLSTNSCHPWGKPIAAACFADFGSALIVREALPAHEGLTLSAQIIVS